jgi:hypothetical protein
MITRFLIDSVLNFVNTSKELRASDANKLSELSEKTKAAYLADAQEKYKDLLEHTGKNLTELFDAAHLKIINPDIINDRFLKLTKLKSIDLSECGLYEVPEQIFKMCCLKTINLSKNNLMTVPINVVHSGFDFIDLSDNKIYRICHKIKKCRNFGKINLQNNPICGTKNVKFDRKYQVLIDYHGYDNHRIYKNMYLCAGEPESNLIKRIENIIEKIQYPCKYKYTQIKI